MTFCVAIADKITGKGRQILFEGLPHPKPRTYSRPQPRYLDRSAKSKLPYRTAKLSSYEAYSVSENDDSDERLCAHEERGLFLLRFPFAVMLEVAYPEMDFANRWCWEMFGPRDGRCYQFQSNYPCCLDPVAHEHQGVWCTHWFAKTDYDFGFNEWYFRDRQHHDTFLDFVPMINWGERFPS